MFIKKYTNSLNIMNPDHGDTFKEQIAAEKMIYSAPLRFEYVEIQKKDCFVNILGSY